MFYDEPRVLYLSLHQYPFYPGTGAAEDVGTGPGMGFTFNVPIEAGAGDADYDLVFRSAVVPVLDAFSPELVLLSAGYDAHDRDPLGGMRVSTSGYARMTRDLCAVADRCCEGRMVTVTEGGYDLEALEECLADTLRVMREPAAPTTRSAGRIGPPRLLRPRAGATRTGVVLACAIIRHNLPDRVRGRLRPPNHRA